MNRQFLKSLRSPINWTWWCRCMNNGIFFFMRTSNLNNPIYSNNIQQIRSIKYSFDRWCHKIPLNLLALFPVSNNFWLKFSWWEPQQREKKHTSACPPKQYRQYQNDQFLCKALPSPFFQGDFRRCPCFEWGVTSASMVATVCHWACHYWVGCSCAALRSTTPLWNLKKRWRSESW